MTLSQAEKYHLLNSWFDTNQGVRVARAFNAELDKVACHIFGKYLLQLGSSGANDLLINLQFRNKIIATPFLPTEKVHTYALLDNLPFADASIDCIVAPFGMELFPHNKEIIAELDRVLKSQGFMIFFGINPLSFWGLAVFLQKIKILTQFSLKLRSVLNLKKLFLNLGYTQSYLNTFYYIPPVNKLKFIQHLEFLNEMGKMVWPYPAGFYCFIVQKCEYGAQVICNETEDIDFVFK